LGDYSAGEAEMAGRKVVLYYAWSRPGEIEAPLKVIEDRFPTLFETRRMLYPRYEALSDPARFDQSIGGFLDHIMKQNFAAFVEQAGAQTGHPVVEIERVATTARALRSMQLFPMRPIRSSSSALIPFAPNGTRAALKSKLFASFWRIRTMLLLSVPTMTSVTCPILRMTSEWNGK
jgi:hypothetical protein